MSDAPALEAIRALVERLEDEREELKDCSPALDICTAQRIANTMYDAAAALTALAAERDDARCATDHMREHFTGAIMQARRAAFARAKEIAETAGPDDDSIDRQLRAQIASAIAAEIEERAPDVG